MEMIERWSHHSKAIKHSSWKKIWNNFKWIKYRSQRTVVHGRADMKKVDTKTVLGHWRKSIWWQEGKAKERAPASLSFGEDKCRGCREKGVREMLEACGDHGKPLAVRRGWFDERCRILSSWRSIPAITTSISVWFQVGYSKKPYSLLGND